MKRTIIWLTVFSIAMGLLETAVVIYLRRMFYPNGFGFPLVPVDAQLALVEFCREAATIIRLVGVGAMIGKDPSQRFAFFIYAFGIWDIFYYVFLKAFLDWPESFFSWDILFLIPVPWVGPVIAPIMVSLTMIALAGAIIYFSESGVNAKLLFIERLLLTFGCLIVIISFVWDYFEYMAANTNVSMWAPGKQQELFKELAHYSPQHYNWWMLALGEIIGLSAILIYAKRLSVKMITKRTYL